MKKVFAVIVNLAFLISSKAQFKDVKSNLELDHIFILVDKKDTTFKMLQKAGLTGANKWKTTHKGQGTTGNFIFFFNFYVEFLAITDSAEAVKNAPNFGSDITMRTNDNANRVGIGLKQIPINKVEIPFLTNPYNQVWMDGDSLLMSTTNTNTLEPLVFVEPQSFANLVINNMVELDSLAKQNPFMKMYRQHGLGLQKLTAVKIVVPTKKKNWSAALKSLTQLKNITVSTGKKSLLILSFDGEKQHKSLDFSSSVGLRINY
jgi:hypothetical protein